MRKIGLRNIKTAISVFICITIFSLLNRQDPFFACIATVICMKESVYNSYIIGKYRMIGTIFGGVLGFLLISIFSNNAIVAALGISLIIYLCNSFGKQDSIVISCVVFLAVMTNLKGVESYIYAMDRIIDTFIGIIIAILVNRALGPNETSD